VILLALSFIVQSQALVLPEIKASTQKALPIDTAAPDYPCDQIAQRLFDYDKMARENDLGLASFLGEVTTKVTAWYDVLSPLEGKKQTLPVGVFLPLQDGSNKITQVADLAFENAGLLATEMDRLKTSLANCVLAPK
jgi:hypothetical protein